MKNGKLVVGALILGACALTASGQNGSRKVILYNDGNRQHEVRLHDHNDDRWRYYTVQPHDELVTKRRWELDTEIYIDGRNMGNIAEVAESDKWNGQPAWAVYFDKNSGRHGEAHEE